MDHLKFKTNLDRKMVMNAEPHQTIIKNIFIFFQFYVVLMYSMVGRSKNKYLFFTNNEKKSSKRQRFNDKKSYNVQSTSLQHDKSFLQYMIIIGIVISCIQFPEKYP